MAALRIGLIALNTTTLAEVTPVRERLETLDARVTIVVPGGGSILPVLGRYYPAAGGHGTRCALNQVIPAEFDLLLLPDSITAEELMRFPQVLNFIRVRTETPEAILPVFQVHYLLGLLDSGCTLDGLKKAREGVLSGSARGR